MTRLHERGNSKNETPTVAQESRDVFHALSLSLVSSGRVHVSFGKGRRSRRGLGYHRVCAAGLPRFSFCARRVSSLQAQRGGMLMLPLRTCDWYRPHEEFFEIVFFAIGRMEVFFVCFYKLVTYVER